MLFAAPSTSLPTQNKPPILSAFDKLKSHPYIVDRAHKTIQHVDQTIRKQKDAAMYRNIQYQKPKSPDEKLTFHESISGRFPGLLSRWKAGWDNPGGMAEEVLIASPAEDIAVTGKEPGPGERDCLWIFLKYTHKTKVESVCHEPSTID